MSKWAAQQEMCACVCYWNLIACMHVHVLCCLYFFGIIVVNSISNVNHFLFNKWDQYQTFIIMLSTHNNMNELNWMFIHVDIGILWIELCGIVRCYPNLQWWRMCVVTVVHFEWTMPVLTSNHHKVEMTNCPLFNTNSALQTQQWKLLQTS